MKKITLFITVSLILSSCLHRKETISQELGTVIEKQYSLPDKSTVTGIISHHEGPRVSYHEIKKDEQFLVLFKCNHGVVFSINRADLYARLEKGDTVLINYYELLNSKGEVRDLDFIDAHKK